MDTDQTDAELVRELFKATPHSRTQLRQVVEKIRNRPADHLLVRWSDSRGSGTPEDPFQFRYPIYDPLIQQLTAALIGANAQPNFNWPEWDGARCYQDADAITGAPLADVLRVITTTIRGERFCDGAIESAITSGVLLAAADRVTEAIPPVG